MSFVKKMLHFYNYSVVLFVVLKIDSPSPDLLLLQYMENRGQYILKKHFVCFKEESKKE